ncbi:MAG: transposase domain-containing protein [Rhodobacter sp.]|nr:transposase domain-containing protein [Rhodobacter sp.]
MTVEPAKTWWTAQEIAHAGLPDMPGTKRGVNDLAKRLNWQLDLAHARRREGRGGGWEYSWMLFPLTARKRILAEARSGNEDPDPRRQRRSREDAWSWFERLPDKIKRRAQNRLAVIETVVALEGHGTTRFLAVEETAKAERIAPRTIWNWLEMIEGVAVCDRLPYLAPRHRARATKPGDRTADAPEFFELLKADFLRLEQPSFSACYRRAADVAKAKGWAIWPERTAQRRMEDRVPRVVQVLARQGVAGLERYYPPQIRDRSSMVAMEGVNADCHKIDVFVAWNADTVKRPQIIAFQDIYSGKILSWRVDWTPNKVAVMAAFGEVVETYGIPERCLFDNGHEFANKWMTGGARTRFRFKIRNDEPLGVLEQLGIKVSWARPGHGQAKPVERAFGDFADDIAKDPRFAGAYVGNRPDAKPENYGSRAIPLVEFLRVVEDRIAHHNARPGRRSHTARGRSFDETFAESLAVAPIRKATEEQRRLWLMGQEVRTLHKSHGRLMLHDNGYWSDWMNGHAGEKIVARFDPEDLHAGVHIYATDGAYLGLADCQQKTGFFDLASAREHHATLARRRREHRKLLEELRPGTAADVAAHLDELPPKEAERVEAKVVRPAFGTRPGKSDPVTPTPSAPSLATAETHQALIAEFKAPRPPESSSSTQDAEDRYARFRRALELEAALEAGDWVGKAEQRWLEGYRVQPEYRSMRKLYEGFGEGIFAG